MRTSATPEVIALVNPAPPTPIPARIEDAFGPRWSRWGCDLGAFVVMLAAVAYGWNGGSHALAAFLFAVGGVLPILGAWVTRHRPRAASLSASPGAVRVRGAGLLSQKIRMKDVRAASTALVGNEYLLTLDLAHHGGRPVTLRLGDRAELDVVLRSLGISTSDVGVVGFQIAPRIGAGLLFAFRALLGLCFLGAAAGALVEPKAGAAGAGLAMMYLFWACFARASGAPDIAFTPRGLALQGKLGYATIPWAQVRGAELQGNRLVLHIPHRAEFAVTFGRPPGAAHKAELEALVAQIRAVVDRVQGRAEPRKAITDRLAHLRRGAGEATQAWFARLDALGTTLAMGSGGYRGVDMDLNEVWAVFEDLDADVELRTAAARLLGKAEAKERVRLRIGPVLATAKHDRVRVAFEAAAERDVIQAAEAYDDVEHAMPRAAMAMRR